MTPNSLRPVEEPTLKGELATGHVFAFIIQWCIGSSRKSSHPLNKKLKFPKAAVLVASRRRRVGIGVPRALDIRISYPFGTSCM